MAEDTGPEFEVRTGIPPGSPLSPVLYLSYNADLLEISIGESLVSGYIDDVSIIMIGRNTSYNNTILTTNY